MTQATSQPALQAATLTPSHLNTYFPPIECPIEPIEDRIVVQLRRPPVTTKSGLILASDTRATEKWNECVGKIIAIGKEAEKTAESWGLQENDFVRIPLYGGDRIAVTCPDNYKFSGESESADILLVTLRVHEVLSKIVVDPTTIQTYIPTRKF